LNYSDSSKYRFFEIFRGETSKRKSSFIMMKFLLFATMIALIIDGNCGQKQRPTKDRLAQAPLRPPTKDRSARAPLRPPTKDRSAPAPQSTSTSDRSEAVIMSGFAEVNGWTFYKIKTRGHMTNFNVKKTCAKNNLITPCYTGTYDAFNGDDCQVVFNKNVTEDADTFQYLSIEICGDREFGNCVELQDTFINKENWVGESACGALAESPSECAYGELYENHYSLCVSNNAAEIEEGTGGNSTDVAR